MSVEAVLTLVVAILGGLGGTIAAVLTAIRNHRQAQRDAVLGEYETIIRKKDEQIDRHDKQADRDERTIDELRTFLAQSHEDTARCERAQEAMHVWAGYAHAWIQRANTVLTSLGHDLGTIPPPPERQSSLRQSEFRLRTGEQDAELTGHLRKKTREENNTTEGGDS